MIFLIFICVSDIILVADIKKKCFTVLTRLEIFLKLFRLFRRLKSLIYESFHQELQRNLQVRALSLPLILERSEENERRN